MRGEAKAKLSATRRFIAEHPACCFCAGRRPSMTREHMPPKALFDGSHRPDKLVMPSCEVCNGGSSTADLVAAIVSRWQYGASDVSNSDHKRLAARLRKQAPEIVDEWTANSGHSLNLRGRQHLERHGVQVPHDAAIGTIGTHTIRQLNLFAHKATLALYFVHFRQPLPGAGLFCSYWKTKEDFALGVPEGLLALLPSYGTLMQGRWNASETFEYRHAINQSDKIFGFLARLRQGLFVSGFALADATLLPNPEEDWVRPGDLIALFDLDRFAKKL